MFSFILRLIKYFITKTKTPNRPTAQSCPNTSANRKKINFKVNLDDDDDQSDEKTLNKSDKSKFANSSTDCTNSIDNKLITTKKKEHTEMITEANSQFSSNNCDHNYQKKKNTDDEKKIYSFRNGIVKKQRNKEPECIDNFLSYILFLNSNKF